MAETESIVLFSGGIDSTTALYWALRRYQKVRPLTFDYGQRNRVEIGLAGKLCRQLRLPHKILKVDLSQIGGSTLTDRSIKLPVIKRLGELPQGPPPTYVPFRNGIFLSLAAAWAEACGSSNIVCGFHVFDSPDYPDTRTAFISAMQKAVNLGSASATAGRKIRLLAPFVRMKKSEIIRLGLSLGADYSYSVSCYRGDEVPCGRCSSCLLRRRAWKEAAAEDHLVSRLRKEGKL